MDMHGAAPKACSDNKWRHPCEGKVKLNSDVAFHAESGESHAGAVARDHRGQVIFSLSKRLVRCSTVEEAEASALMARLRSLSDLYRGPIIVETDCMAVANCLQPGVANLSACYHVIVDTRRELENFSEAQIMHINWNQNILAHHLAARARCKADMLMVEGLPEDLDAVLAADVLVG
ncbi:uncharacterized protein [Aegilops tauschii subsp. strangulata]|uniref:uncharacterized protein n=1 Tax=Aegilops tauschii subsp. strangulata TaxID=200361 RepID=UPI003CC8AF25